MAYSMIDVRSYFSDHHHHHQPQRFYERISSINPNNNSSYIRRIASSNYFYKQNCHHRNCKFNNQSSIIKNNNWNMKKNSSTSNNADNNQSIKANTIINNNNSIIQNDNYKIDTLVDRKAFISLEKSINWQSLLANQNPQLIKPNKTINDRLMINDDNLNEFSKPGMKCVPSWLKLLRLHKYSSIFAHMSYDDMMNITEQYLEKQNITKGARQKLYLSIQKLHARSAVLLASEQQLIDLIGESDTECHNTNQLIALISQIIFQIRAFLSTPINCCNDESDQSLLASVINGNNKNNDEQSFKFSSLDINNNNGSIINKNDPIDLSLLNDNDLTTIITRLIGQVIKIITSKSCMEQFNNRLTHQQQQQKSLVAWMTAIDNDDNYKTVDNIYCKNNANITTVNHFATADYDYTDDEVDNDLDYDDRSMQTIISYTDVYDNCFNNQISSSINDYQQQYKELFFMMEKIINKCLSHESFIKYYAILQNQLQQLQSFCKMTDMQFNDCDAAISIDDDDDKSQNNNNNNVDYSPYRKQSQQHSRFATYGDDKDFNFHSSKCKLMSMNNCNGYINNNNNHNSFVTRHHVQRMNRHNKYINKSQHHYVNNLTKKYDHTKNNNKKLDSLIKLNEYKNDYNNVQQQQHKSNHYKNANSWANKSIIRNVNPIMTKAHSSNDDDDHLQDDDQKLVSMNMMMITTTSASSNHKYDDSGQGEISSSSSSSTTSESSLSPSIFTNDSNDGRYFYDHFDSIVSDNISTNWHQKHDNQSLTTLLTNNTSLIDDISTNESFMHDWTIAENDQNYLYSKTLSDYDDHELITMNNKDIDWNYDDNYCNYYDYNQFNYPRKRQPDASESSTNITFDDIEQLSIRIAEHALEING